MVTGGSCLADDVVFKFLVAGGLPNYIDTRVLAREEDTTKRKIKEALAIKKVTNGRRDGVIINLDSGMKINKLW